MGIPPPPGVPPPPGMPPPPPGPPNQPPPQPGYPQPYPPQYPIFPGIGSEAPGATAAMVCGIVSLAVVPLDCCTYGLAELASLPLGILAVVLGFRARGKISQSRGTLGGDNKAMAGIVTGIIGIAVAVVVGVIVLLIGLSLPALQNAFPSPSP